MPNRLSNTVTLVTGAAKGIGAAIATLFSQEGSKVILTDIDDEAGHLLSASLQADYHHLEVSSEEAWISVIEAIQAKYGQLNILINNAGITGLAHSKMPHNPEEISLQAWRQVHAENLDGVMLGCKHTIPLMKRSTYGSIVNLSSRSGMVGIPTASAYASSKAGVRNHSKSVALYCAEKGYNIRCNSIHPGAILTPLWDDMLGTGNQKAAAIDAISQGIPLGHMGTPMDVAFAALYLASQESQYVTGSELTIDGGILAGSAAAPKDQ